MISKRVYTLQPSIFQDFDRNLDFIIAQLYEIPYGGILLAPEVALTGFAYQRMEEASEFSKKATEKLLSASEGKTFMTTMIEKKNKNFYNNFKVFHHGSIIHKQAKSKLFSLGDEHLYFKEGDSDECVPFVIDGVKCGALVGFELRFLEMWNQMYDAEIIFIPAQWAKIRKMHFETLSRALAIANQSFVITSNPSNQQVECGSAIITPYGLVHLNDHKHRIELEIDLEEVVRMRKYIQTKRVN